MFKWFKKCKHENVIKERIAYKNVLYYMGSMVECFVFVKDMFFCPECKTEISDVVAKYPMNSVANADSKLIQLENNGIKIIIPKDWIVINTK